LPARNDRCRLKKAAGIQLYVNSWNDNDFLDRLESPFLRRIARPTQRAVARQAIGIELPTSILLRAGEVIE
jgi:hypothetical protein